MKGRLIRTCLILAALAAAVISCTHPGTSIKDRIFQFISDINTNRPNAYENFHPDSSQYGLIAGVTDLWDIHFDAIGIPYTVSGINDSDPNNVTASIDDKGGTGWAPKAVIFKMRQLGTDWMISELWLNGVQIVF
jgi:hypothetical protein